MSDANGSLLLPKTAELSPDAEKVSSAARPRSSNVMLKTVEDARWIPFAIKKANVSSHCAHQMYLSKGGLGTNI